MMKYVASAFLSSLVLLSPLTAAELIPIRPTTSLTSSTLGLTVVATDVELPAGRWDISAVKPAGVLEQVF